MREGGKRGKNLEISIYYYYLRFSFFSLRIFFRRSRRQAVIFFTLPSAEISNWHPKVSSSS